MKNLLVCLFSLFTSLYCNAQSSNEIIVISQSLRGGNGSYTLYVGIKNAKVDEVRNQKETNFSICIIDKKMLNFVAKVLISHSKFIYTQNELDGYQVFIRYISKKQLLSTSFIENRLDVSKAFESIILEIKRSSFPTKKKNNIINEFQKIIDYATKPEFSKDNWKLVR